MVTKVEIARHLGITKMHAGRLVKRGCPLTSLKAAKLWRDANPPKRAATNRKTPAPEIKPATKTAKAPTKSPRINPKATEKSLKATTEPVGRSKAPPKVEKPALPPKLVKSGDSLLDALNGAIMASDYALEKLMDAMANSPFTAGARLSEYSRALTVRMTTEVTWRKEQERRNVLVDKAKIMQLARMSIEAMKRRAQRIPNEAGPQCNPQEPLVATKVLEREMAALMRIGAKELDGLVITRRV